MRAGKLRHRVTFQYKVVTRDGFGAEVVTWTDLAILWAQVEPLRGRELTELQLEAAEVTTRITVRYWGGIAPEMRATYDGHTYDIVSVVNVEERDREMEILCREVL